MEGALAAEPAPDPMRGRVEPLREIPGMRKRERTWKDEVRERVRQRRQERAGQGELPLFAEGEADEDATEGEDEPEVSAAVEGDAVESSHGSGLPPIDIGGDEPTVMDDLPLRPRTESAALEVRDEIRSVVPPRPETWPELPAEPDRRFSLGEADEPRVDRPVERPALPGERTQAAVLDLALLGSLAAVVVYFASRAAHVTVAGLRPAALYLAAYLAGLALLYAGYFTGTTGQTLGKILLDLRVVDAGGRPPGYLRASLRALLGSLGILFGFAGVLPVFFDPARRGFHDRLLKTRVVRR